MPGNPVEQDLLAQIEREGGWERIWERVTGGENQMSLAKSFAVTQGFFSRVMHKDPARVLAFREAKKQAATYTRSASKT